MAITVEQVDLEITKLQKIRELLASDGTPMRKRRGFVSRTVSPAGPKRVISEAARRKIGEAQKARWAKIRASKKA
jgi:hypothetical protein